MTAGIHSAVTLGENATSRLVHSTGPDLTNTIGDAYLEADLTKNTEFGDTAASTETASEGVKLIAQEPAILHLMEPGVGKSALAHQIAAAARVEIITINGAALRELSTEDAMALLLGRPRTYH
jgi:hypothetical protein